MSNNKSKAELISIANKYDEEYVIVNYDEKINSMLHKLDYDEKYKNISELINSTLNTLFNVFYNNVIKSINLIKMCNNFHNGISDDAMIMIFYNDIVKLNSNIPIEEDNVISNIPIDEDNVISNISKEIWELHNSLLKECMMNIEKAKVKFNLKKLKHHINYLFFRLIIIDCKNICEKNK